MPSIRLSAIFRSLQHLDALSVCLLDPPQLFNPGTQWSHLGFNPDGVFEQVFVHIGLCRLFPLDPLFHERNLRQCKLDIDMQGIFVLFAFRPPSIQARGRNVKGKEKCQIAVFICSLHQSEIPMGFGVFRVQVGMQALDELSMEHLQLMGIRSAQKTHYRPLVHMLLQGDHAGIHPRNPFFNSASR